MLMAVVDANLEFLYTDVGQYGRHADGGIWRECSLNANMNAKTAHLPKPAALPGTQILSPYVFVGDGAFPLTENLQRPYCRRDMDEHQMIFNYRLSRARRVSENAFGVMSNRFRCLLSNMQLLPDTATTVVIKLGLAASCTISCAGSVGGGTLLRRCVLLTPRRQSQRASSSPFILLWAANPPTSRSKRENVSRITSRALVRYHGRIKS